MRRPIRDEVATPFDVANCQLPIPNCQSFSLASSLSMIDNPMAFCGSERKKPSHLTVVGWGGERIK